MFRSSIEKISEETIGIIAPEASSSHQEYAALLLSKLSHAALSAHYGSGVTASAELEDGVTCESVAYHLEHLIADYPILDENTLSYWAPTEQHLFVQADKRRLKLPSYHSPLTWLPLSIASTPPEDVYKVPPRELH